jgi:hypothetical protein
VAMVGSSVHVELLVEVSLGKPCAGVRSRRCVGAVAEKIQETETSGGAGGGKAVARVAG